MTRIGILLLAASFSWMTQAGAGATVDALYLRTSWADALASFYSSAGGSWGIALACLLLGAGLLAGWWGSGARVEPSRASHLPPRPSRSERLEAVGI